MMKKIIDTKLCTMNKKLAITLQILRISLASFSQLYATHEDLKDGVMHLASAPSVETNQQRIIDRLTQGMNAHDKSSVITAMSEMPTERLATFEAVVDRLSAGINEIDRSRVINALAAVPTDRLTAAFEVAVNRFSAEIAIMNRPTKRLNQHNKSRVISALAAVPTESLAAFEEAVNRLSAGMNAHDKSSVISAVAVVPAERLAAFETVVNRLTERMSKNNKSRVIRSVTVMPTDRLNTLINNFFTNQILQQLAQFVPPNASCSLIETLAASEPNTWQAEITRVINEYRHTAAPNQTGAAFEVHRYANTQVTTSSSANSSSSPLTMSLNDAVIGNMNERLQTAGIALIPYVDAEKLLNSWIEAKYSNPDDQVKAKHAAFTKLASDLEYEQVISTVVSFLQKFHSKSIDLWLDGFLKESTTAYKNNGESCAKGIKERVATGVRTIDPELDSIFTQAEGPALARAFMVGLNLSDTKRCKEITKELVKRGLTRSSSAVEAADIFERYMKESFASYGVDSAKYSTHIRQMKLLVAADSGFEAFIQPILKQLEDEKLRAMQDAEYAESVAADLAKPSFVKPAEIVASQVAPAVAMALSEDERRRIAHEHKEQEKKRERTARLLHFGQVAPNPQEDNLKGS